MSHSPIRRGLPILIVVVRPTIANEAHGTYTSSRLLGRSMLAGCYHKALPIFYGHIDFCGESIS